MRSYQGDEKRKERGGGCMCVCVGGGGSGKNKIKEQPRIRKLRACVLHHDQGTQHV